MLLDFNAVKDRYLKLKITCS